MSDFRQLIITIFKVKRDNLPPKFQVSLKNVDMNNSSFIELKAIFMEATLLKTKYLRANFSKFMTKKLTHYAKNQVAILIVEKRTSKATISFIIF